MPVSLLHPGLFAIGLACVSIPIIIHLLKRRRRVVSWGAMRFLEEAYRKRRRIITLEQLILLSLRCLLMVLIALGVGSLMLGSGASSSKPRTLIIVLDDSIGSALVVDGQSALETSRARAIEQIDSLDTGRGDRVALISASAPARAMVLPPSDDIGAVRSLIEQVEPSDAPLDLTGVSALLAQGSDDEERTSTRMLMFASDARAVSEAMRRSEQLSARVGFDTLLLTEPDDQPASNIGIRDARPTRSLVVRDGLSLPEAIRVELVRSGDPLNEQRSSVRVIDQQGIVRGNASVEWSLGQRQTAQSIAIDTNGLSPHAGSSSILRVRIDDDANSRDNSCVVTLPVRDTLRIGVIDRPSPSSGVLGTSGSISPSRWARAALSPGDTRGVQITSIDARQADSRLVPSLDAVLVLAPNAMTPEGWDRLARLHELGAMLIVTPDAQIESLAWLDRVRAMSPEVFSAGERTLTHSPPVTLSEQAEPSGLLAGIAGEYPQLAGAVEVYRSLSIPDGARPIAMLSDSTPLGVHIPAKDSAGAIVLLALPLDLNWSNLPTRPLFVAMMQEIVRQGVGEGVAGVSTIAGEPIAQSLGNQSVQRVALQDEAQRESQSGNLALDTTHDLNQIAGVLAQRDAQGSIRSLRVIRPAASAAIADTTSRDELSTQLGSMVSAEQTRWVSDDQATTSETAKTASSTDARSLALWMLWAGLGVAILEFILARLFTARLIASERAMGSKAQGAGA